MSAEFVSLLTHAAPNLVYLLRVIFKGRLHEHVACVNLSTANCRVSDITFACCFLQQPIATGIPASIIRSCNFRKFCGGVLLKEIDISND